MANLDDDGLSFILPLRSSFRALHFGSKLAQNQPNNRSLLGNCFWLVPRGKISFAWSLSSNRALGDDDADDEKSVEHPPGLAGRLSVWAWILPTGSSQTEENYFFATVRMWMSWFFVSSAFDPSGFLSKVVKWNQLFRHHKRLHGVSEIIVTEKKIIWKCFKLKFS